MRTFSILLTAAFLLGLGAASASAIEIEEKSIELDGSFNFQHTSVSIDDLDLDGSFTVFDFEALIGYFINSNVEILGGLLITRVSTDEDFGGVGSSTGFGITTKGRFHFDVDGEVIPFVGLGLGLVAHGGDGPDEMEFIFPEISGGMRFPLLTDLSVNVEGGFRHRSNAFGIDEAGGMEIFLGAGFTFFWQGGYSEF